MNNRVTNTHEYAREICSSYRLLAGLLLVTAVMVSGCGGLRTFSNAARNGDTVTLSVDRQTDFTRDDVDIQITDSTGYTQLIPGSDPSIRGWINAYPDPVSKIIVGRETSQTFGIGAKGNGVAAESQSNWGKDWFTTLVLLDLPTDLATGTATIDVLSGGASILDYPITIDIIPGTGSPNSFDTVEQGQLNQNHLKSMERADHYTVSFSGPVVPSAIQVDLAHDPDRENGGTGQTYVTQPRSDLNAVNWTDDGSLLRVIITSAWNKSPEDITAITGNDRQMSWFDFYIAGGITGLQTPVVSAYDDNGAPVLGVTATIH